MTRMSEENVQLARMLDAVSDPVRMRIVFFLVEQGRKNVGDIARDFTISRPAISHHLKVLKDSGVVESEKLGQEVFYWINTRQVVNSLRALADRIERIPCSANVQG